MALGHSCCYISRGKKLVGQGWLTTAHDIGEDRRKGVASRESGKPTTWLFAENWCLSVAAGASAFWWLFVVLLQSHPSCACQLHPGFHPVLHASLLVLFLL